LSYTVIVMSAVTGSGLFATLSKQNESLQFALAVLSVIAAAIVGYQRSAQYAARSVEHQRAGAGWNPIVNQTEQYSLSSTQPTDAALTRIEKEMDAVTKSSPQIPERVFKKFRIPETYLYEPPNRPRWGAKAPKRARAGAKAKAASTGAKRKATAQRGR